VLSGDDSAICCVSYGLQGERCEVCHIDVFRSIDENFTMSLPKLTGNLFRAGRVLAGLTRDDLAGRAGLSRDVPTAFRSLKTCSTRLALRLECGL
jgi:hypothetical protein